MNVPTLFRTDRETTCRYTALALPRHTSYPMAPVWTRAYGAAAFRGDLLQSATARRPLSLYVHVPGAWSWFMDERAIVNDGKLIVGSVRAVGSFRCGDVARIAVRDVEQPAQFLEAHAR